MAATRRVGGLSLHMVCAIGIGLCGAAPADTYTLIADRDAGMFSESDTAANGVGDYFHVGRNGNGDRRRGLVYFHLSSIPAGSTITSVTLRLYNGKDNGGPDSNISLHRLTQEWLEGPADGGDNGGHGVPARANDVTWHWRIFNTQAWTDNGGTFDSTASATTTVPSTVGPSTWSGAGLVADVQDWLDGAANNRGWLLKGNEAEDRSARRIASRQNPVSGNRPKLTVVFTPPIFYGACCAADGICTLLTATECAAAGGDYQGDSTSCSPNPCPQPMGACCDTADFTTCTLKGAADCAAAKGLYRGDGTDCSPNPCIEIWGACCFENATCVAQGSASCDASSGVFQGYDTTCAGVTCPWILTPFVDPLPIPPVATPTAGSAGGVAHYDIAMTEFWHQFHDELPQTRVWGYGTGGAGTYPGPTIEARRNQVVTVTWINNLRTAGGALRTTHMLPVDTCLHGPNITGQVPVTVVHLHGGHVRPESDGIPDLSFAPGSSSPLYIYPNNQPATTLWYHDHALGLTRLNVYMGLAGFYLIRDADEESVNLPRAGFDIPLVIQDRSFHPNGTLKYNPSFNDQFFGDFITVNGKVWPYMAVQPRKYRFRLLNGSNTRTYSLRLTAPFLEANAQWWVIGTDQGLLDVPVSLNNGLLQISRPLVLMPGERADVIIDFANMGAGQAVTLTNTAPSPFPTGGAGPDIVDVMQFRVQGPIFSSELPPFLIPVDRLTDNQAMVTRTFKLGQVTDPVCGHDMWLINSLMWDDITDFPQLDSREIWRWVNNSGISHPMHVHLVAFQVLDRQDFTEDNLGNITPVGLPIPPSPEELGWKDTVQATPNQITRIIAKFEDYPGTYPFHCHILEHEDHEMMRQFTVQCAPLLVTAQPANLTVRATQVATFSASASGSGPFTYQWRKGSAAVVDPGTPILNGPTGLGSSVSGATGSMLAISSVQLADATHVWCRITDPCGISRITTRAQLRVLCPADINLSSTVTVQDIFDFLAAYFAGSLSADLNNNGLLSVQDIFDFLAAYFTPCP